MAILIKGTDFTTGDQVTAAALDLLVDGATFDTGAVDNSTTQLSGGAIIVKDLGITPSKLSTGAPTWTAGGAVSVGSLVPTTAIAVANGGTGATTASAARTALGVAIGTDVQAYDADLAAIAGLTSAADKVPYFTGSAAAALADFKAPGRAVLAAADNPAIRALLLPGYQETIDGTQNGWGVFSGAGVFRTSRDTTDLRDHHVFYNPNGNVGAIYTEGSSTTYSTSSDRRLKDFIESAPSLSDRLDAVEVRQYEFKAEPGKKMIGFIAQELVEQFPEAVVRGDEEKQWGVDYSKLVPALVQEVQSLRKRVKALEEARAGQ